MAVTQNTYTGNGSTTNYSFTFPYLDSTDIKVSLNGTVTTAYTLANATTVQFNTAPANGAAIRIYRQTDDAALAATFYPGSAIRSADLNENFTQNLYVTQEANNVSAAATTTANTALTNSNTAISTANTALSTANTASSNASAAVATANTASSNASAAVSTANTASSNATTAVNTANAATTTANNAAADAATANTTANSAVSTANAASTAATNAVNTSNAASATASSAVTTANTASANATTAVNTANSATTTANSATTTANTANAKADSAIAAISSSAVFTPVANVAAIPGSPTNGQNIQVTDSTGIESFTPLAGLPVGFVGDSGIAARIQYSGGTWNWFGYLATNSDARYLKQSGGTLTGQLKADDSTSTAAPVYSFDGDTNTGIAHTGADELALVTGGTPRLTIDGSGNATFSNAVTLPAGSSVIGYLTTTAAGTTYAPLASPTFTGTATSPSITVTGSTAPTNGVYLSAANRLALATNSSGKLFINNVGQVGFGDESFNHDYSFYQSSNTTLRIANSSSTTASNRGALVYLAGSDLSIANQEAGFLRLFTNGTERLRITSAGRIGFGQTAPATTVDVNGAHSANVTAVAALNIDCSLGNLFTKTINGNSTFTVSNVPASRSYAFTLELTHTSGTITWFSGVVWPGGTAPTLTTGKVHLFMFFTDDGGTTWRASSLINY